MMHFNKKNIPTLVIVTASAALLGCNGGGGGSSSKQAEITMERVTDRIDTTIANVASCEKNSNSEALRSLNAQQIQDVLSAARSLTDASKSTQNITIRPSASVGSCSGNPGSVSVSSEHSNGNTRYELDFNSYCTSGPEGDTVLTGVLVTTEDGSPTDSGPMIYGLDMSSDELQVQYEDDLNQNQTALVSISNARTEFGVPGIRGSGTPTLENPDITTIGSMKVDVETTGEVHRIKGLELSRSGGDTATVSISDGSYISPEGDSVDISTEDGSPLVINVSSGEIASGELVLSGKNDSIAVVSATNESGVMTVNVNGVELDEAVDCTNSQSGVGDVVGILLSNLPIY